MVERYVDEASLAWALALTAKPRLGDSDRNDVFVLIGAGETFEAIRRLIKVVAVKHIPVKSDLALGCSSWLRGYAGHDDEESLRRHIDGFVLPGSPRFPAAIQANRVPPTLDGQLPPLSRLVDTDQAYVSCDSTAPLKPPVRSLAKQR
jgi:hypothetical protein